MNRFYPKDAPFWLGYLALLLALHLVWTGPSLEQIQALRESTALELARSDRYAARLKREAVVEAALANRTAILQDRAPLVAGEAGSRQLATALNAVLDGLRGLGLEKRRVLPVSTAPWGNLTEARFGYDLAGDIVALAGLAQQLDAFPAPLVTRRFCVRVLGLRSGAPLEIKMTLAAVSWPVPPTSLKASPQPNPLDTAP